MPKADNGGLRYNKGKVMMHLLPADALLEVAKVYTSACQPTDQYPEGKYPKRNWERGMDYSNVTDSLERHLAAFKLGEDIDAESGMMHAAQIVWNALALLTYQLRGIGVDDRHKVHKLPTIAELEEILDKRPKPITKSKIAAYTSDGHASDCALHNGPAMEPENCDCGADPSMTPEKYGSERPALDPQLVEIKVGLCFRLNIGDPDIWEIIKDYGTGRFLARCDDHDKEPQMMTIRAIREIVTEAVKPASHRCYHCPDDAPAGELLCPKCKETPRI